jgi:hypothetical protein
LAPAPGGAPLCPVQSLRGVSQPLVIDGWAGCLWGSLTQVNDHIELRPILCSLVEPQ